MLSMVAYDINTKEGHKWRDLERGIKACEADQHNVGFAPWFIADGPNPEVIMERVTGALGEGDNLLVLRLGEGVSATLSNPQRQLEDRLWLERHGVDFRGRERTRVQVIAYTLHDASPGDYEHIRKGIADRFGDHLDPVHALWFVADTGETPSQLCHELQGLLPSRHDDELMVFSIPDGTVGTSSLMASGEPRNSDVITWFSEHGIALD